jgi:hypothetical protein
VDKAADLDDLCFGLLDLLVDLKGCLRIHPHEPEGGKAYGQDNKSHKNPISHDVIMLQRFNGNSNPRKTAAG